MLERSWKAERRDARGDYTGSVTANLNSRRGPDPGARYMRGNANVVNAMVPLNNMFGT